MDGSRFDLLTRALAWPGSRRRALAAFAALLPAVAAGSAASARRRRGCHSKCAAGFACEHRACVCPSGVTCGGVCCASGQRCEGGACVTPEPPPACIPVGRPCKGLGRACCDGRTCASGQGGKMDIACWVPAGGACAATADCVYGAACRGGVCIDTSSSCTVCAEGCPYETIEAALANPALAVIRVGAGTYRPDDGIQESHRLAIRRSVTIEACGDGPVTIDGQRRGGVVWIGSAGAAPLAVTLRGLSIVGGRTGSGAGVFDINANGETTLEDVSISGCESEFDGGAVSVGDGSRLRIAGSSAIRDNRAGGNGGGVYVHVAATVRIEGRTVIRDNAAGGNGGGVFSPSAGTLVLAGQAAVTGNVAGSDGGGVYVVDGAEVSCEGAPSVCGNAALCPPPDCYGTLGASCAGVCCVVGDAGRGEVGAAGC